LPVAQAVPALSLPDRPSPEEEIDEECGRAVVVADQIPQENVDDVFVEAKSGHGEETISLAAIAPAESLYRSGAFWQKALRRTWPMLKRIKFMTVPVQDQTRALDFYSKKLGLKIFTDQAMGEDRWIELQVPGAETLLVLHKAKSQANGATPAVVFE